MSGRSSAVFSPGILRCIGPILAIKAMFPNLSKLAAICLLFFFDCEKGFSALSHIKTNLHNRLSSRILNGLMTITVEGPHQVNFHTNKLVISGRVGGIAEWMLLFKFFLFQNFFFPFLNCSVIICVHLDVKKFVKKIFLPNVCTPPSLSTSTVGKLCHTNACQYPFKIFWGEHCMQK